MHYKYLDPSSVAIADYDHYNAGHQSVEYKLFTDYYSKLVDTLPASDLSHYFVSDKIISLEDHERIIKSTVTQDAAKLLLDRVSFQLQNGNNMVLSKMLLIMDYRGIDTAKTISLEIRNKLSSLKCEDSTVNSSRQGIKTLTRHTHSVNASCSYQECIIIC